jgi:hypothetical protein
VLGDLQFFFGSSFVLICRCLADLPLAHGSSLCVFVDIATLTTSGFMFHPRPGTSVFFSYAAPRHGSRVSLFSVGIAPSAFSFFFEHATPRHGPRVSLFSVGIAPSAFF